MTRDDCEYANVQHDCTGNAAWRVWADVTMEWHYACPAAVDALTTPGDRQWSPASAASRGAKRINLVMEELG